MKTLVISDIHGCYGELQTLLDKAGLADDDAIIAVGDLINRGPEDAKVIDFFRHHPQARSVMGNHEFKHIRAAKGELIPSLAVLLARWDIDADYADALRYMESLPAYIDLPEATILHGFFEPDIPLEKQEHRVLVGTYAAEQYLQTTYKQVWYKLYRGKKPLIVGHRDYSDGKQKVMIHKDRVWAIDTRCVYGGSLTGLLLPDFELITVPARRNHWQHILERYSGG